MAGPRLNIDKHLGRVADNPSISNHLKPSQNNESTLPHPMTRQPSFGTQKSKPSGFQFKDDTLLSKAVNPTTTKLPTAQLTENKKYGGKPNGLPKSINTTLGPNNGPSIKRPIHFSPASSPGLSVKRPRVLPNPPEKTIIEEIPLDIFEPDGDEEQYMNELSTHLKPLAPPAPLPSPSDPPSRISLVNGLQRTSAGISSTSNPRVELSSHKNSPSLRTPSSNAPQVPTRREFMPSVPARPFIEPTLQEMDLQTLYVKRHACMSQIKIKLETIITYLKTGSCESGEDYGLLEHSRLYLETRLNEFNTEIENRQNSANGNSMVTAVIPPARITTPLEPRGLPNQIFTSPSTTSRVSSEPVHPGPLTPTARQQASIPKPVARSVSNSVNPVAVVSMPQDVRPLRDTQDHNSFEEQPVAGPSHHKFTNSKQDHQHPTSPHPIADDLHDTDALLRGIFSGDEGFSDDQHAPPTRLEIRPQRQIPVPAPQKIHDSSNINKAVITNTTSPTGGYIDVNKEPYEDSRSKMKHPWSKDVAKALTSIFKLKAWRRNQLDAINATLSGDHCFVLMPTGGGKSLCYQLPAVIRSGKTRGVTIVVSPLLSLITDQIQSLCEKEIGAAPWTGTMSKQEKAAVTNDLRSKEPLLCLLYVTPESMMQSGELRGILKDLQRRNLIARFVIDEAHCLSQWGHDFRPDYITLGQHLAVAFSGIPILALTATANGVVQQDIIKNLRIESCVKLTQSFNRPNLRYEVRPKTKEAMNEMIRIITVDHAGKCGIIYCFSKRDCEQVASELVKRGNVRAHHYHAGMSSNDRQRIQQDWQKGVLQVLCATIAFGMGIDKPDVRFVLHYSLPSSLEGYYQETGRAGRDGLLSECILFYAYRDFLSIQRMVEQEPNVQQVERRLVNARRVVAFCLNKLDCRRMQVLDYFSETFSPEECKKTCDNCMAGQSVVHQDVTNYVVSAIKLIKRLTESDSITMVQCIDVFRGSKNKKIVDAGHHMLDEAGVGSAMDRTDVERLFQFMMTKNIWVEQFKSTGVYTNSYMALAPGHKEYLYKGAKFFMPFADGPPNNKRTKANAGDPDPPQRKCAKATAPRAPVENDVDDYDNHDDADYEFEDEITIEKPHPLPLRRGTAKKVKNATNNVDHSYKALMALRDKSMADGNEDDAIPLEIIQIVACLNPTTQKALLEIEGIDKEFVKTHGAAILKICRQSAKQSQAAGTAVEDPSSKAAPAKTTASKFNEQIKHFVAPSSNTRAKPVKRPTASSASHSGIRAMPMPK